MSKKEVATPQNVRSLVPAGSKLKVMHFHDGNDPDHEIRGDSVYATYASLIDSRGNIVATAESRCCPKDVPSRTWGWHIAVNRLLSNL